MPTTKTATKKTTKKTVKTATPSEELKATALEAEDVLEDVAAAAQDQFATAFQTMTGAYEQMRQQFEKTQSNYAEVSAKMMQAAQTEVSDAVQFANDLATAKTFGDALEVQQSYWTNLMHTRMERARELTELSVEAARANLPAETTAPLANMFDTSAYEKFFPFGQRA